MKKDFFQSIIKIMLAAVIISWFSYSNLFSYQDNEQSNLKNSAYREDCISLANNLTINMCVIYNGAKYGFVLKYAPEISDLVWKMDISTFIAINSPNIACIPIDSTLALEVPCVEYGENQYKIKMEYHINSNDPKGLYWKLANIELLEPAIPTPEEPTLPEADFTITLGAKDGREIKPLNSVCAGPITSDIPSNADLTEQYKELGIKYVRTHDFYGPFDMSEIYPDRTKNPLDLNSYNFKDSDTNYEAIVGADATIYFRLGDSYNNPTPPEKSELSNWIEASINIIAHYYEGKWEGYNGKFEYVEIWNEPDNSHFWPNKSLIDFFVLFDATAKRIRQEFPDIKIGGPGFTQNLNFNEDRKAILNDFLDYIKNNNTPIDFISFHEYTNEPSDITEATNSLKSTLKEKGFEGLSMHITEWNTDAEQPKEEQSSEEKAELRLHSRGAAVNTGTWIEMQNNGIDMAFFFRGNDTNIDMPLFYGLYLADGTPKKTAFAFNFFNQISKYKDRLEASVEVSNNGSQSDINSSIYFIAGENAKGDKAIIVSNLTDKQYRYTLKNSKDGQTANIVNSNIISASGISDDHSNIYDIVTSTQNSDDEVRFDLPAYGVQLITVEQL
ncbi:MAG: hypothetical protein HQK64_09805 [Desulfamplus sp.]|nr:hypothetical protein [Desulfamplus sp.]